MTDARSLAGLAQLLADATRAGVCLALLDGRAWTAGELARAAGVVPSTMSAHLDRLVAGGLLVQERQGRHRYLRLADTRTAALVEGLAAHRAPDAAPTGSLRVVSAHSALVEARTCYDHLAGRLGVAVLDALCDKGYVERTDGLAVTADGVAWLTDLGVDVPALRASRRPMVRDCLDWTERRHHLAGAVGAAVCERFVARGWVERTRRPRALQVTRAGREALAGELGLGWGVVNRWTLLPSPVDDLLAVSDGDSLTGLWFAPHDRQLARLPDQVQDDRLELFAEVRAQLAGYFAGERREFELPLAPAGSAFQLAVWSALREIPYGSTRSYGDIAGRLGLGPQASRAIGSANGSNPLPVVVPCHRVIGADGSLTGFGGGLARKRFLLDLEADLLF